MSEMIAYRFIPAGNCRAGEKFYLRLDGRDFQPNKPLKDKCGSCTNPKGRALLVAIFGKKGLEEVQCIADCSSSNP